MIWQVLRTTFFQVLGVLAVWAAIHFSCDYIQEHKEAALPFMLVLVTVGSGVGLFAMNYCIAKDKQRSKES